MTARLIGLGSSTVRWSGVPNGPGVANGAGVCMGLGFWETGVGPQPSRYGEVVCLYNSPGLSSCMYVYSL